MPPHRKIHDVSRALDDGFRVADVRSDAASIDVELVRDELTLTIHITRDEAREILETGPDASRPRAG